MLHPSYTELMNSINSESEEPIVNSRYSIVIAAAKRARQLINGASSEVEDYKNIKPLSVAVEELMDGKVKILAGAVDDEDDEPVSIPGSDAYGSVIDDEDEGYEEDEEDSDEFSEDEE